MERQSRLNMISGGSIVVTGGAGFIGSHLTERLLSLNANKVTVIDSLDYGSEKNISSDNRVAFRKFKIGTDPIDNLKGYLDDADCLFHLAAEKHNQSAGDPHAMYKTNIIGTSDLFELAGFIYWLYCFLVPFSMHNQKKHHPCYVVPSQQR